MSYPKINLGSKTMTEFKKVTINEYINALEKMKKSPDDRIGILGKLGVTGLGGIAGASAAGTVATTAGVATLFGSSTLASLLGGIFVTTTPVGWVVGGIALGGTVGYGISKVVSNGGKSNAIKEMNILELKEKISKLREQSKDPRKPNDKMVKIIEGLQLLIKNKKISQQESTDLLSGIEKNSITVDFAFDTIKEILNSRK